MFYQLFGYKITIAAVADVKADAPGAATFFIVVKMRPWNIPSAIAFAEACPLEI